ncbi:GntR family transcriptional regulator [Rhizocola hellebori]|uniref:GntR family transcriptional regulator n=1 Tax=Rhizocola hellebori TaxID=1392758 RepID=A0A8J3QJM0_9ACTN|nr:aminotransferase class I/II-fold pyridoxal phosphate-dependent enzyme [Rhizocola hellebori]GIH10939.1 GntR family transcriptional regulator [Rhizocola hellebori]
MAVHYRVSGETATAIAASIEEGVRGGALKPGAALPAVRALAVELGVSPATVASAYQRLRQRGIVATAGRNGTRVRSAPPISALRSTRAVAVPDGLRNLSSGEPDPALLPRLQTTSAANVGYSGAGPLPEFLAAAKKRLPRLPSDTRLTLVSGSLDGMDKVLTAHLRPGDRVGVEDPGWAACLDLLAVLGLVPVPIPVDEEGPTLDGVLAALERGVSAIIVTTRAQNPTGAAVSAARALLLRPLLKDVLVIEDDHAAELAGVPLHSVAGEGPRWAFLRSASKPYGPDLRCAVLAGDPETVSRVEGRMRLTSGWVSTLLQRTLLQLWETFDPVQAGQVYDRRRDAMLAALRARGVAAFGRTGINVWIPVPDETQVIAALRDAGYAVAPGSLYRVASPPAVRVTIATLKESEVDDLADAVARAIRNDLRPMVGR